jgi:hypothetical protein
MKLVERYRAHRDSSRRRHAYVRAIDASLSPAMRVELQAMFSRSPYNH